MFVRLGVFAGDFSLDAVEAVTEGAPWAADLLGTLLELVDGSLLRQHGDADVPLFSMLVPVREIAAARFDLEPDAAEVRRAHADHYVRLAAEMEPLLHGSTQVLALDRLEAERDNLRAAFRHLLEIDEVDAVADAVWRLLLYWWIRSYLPEAKTWTQDALDVGGPVSTRTRAISLAFPSWVSLWQTDAEIDTEALEQSVRLFRETGDEFSASLALTVLSLAYMSVDPPDLELAEARQREGLESRGRAPRRHVPCALRRRARSHPGTPRRPGRGVRACSRRHAPRPRRAGDLFAESVALTQIGWGRLAVGDPAPELFLRNLELALRLGNDVGVAFALEGLGATSTWMGDVVRGGELLGAAENLRTRTGLWDQRAYITYQPFVEAALASAAGAEFEAAHARGGGCRDAPSSSWRSVRSSRSRPRAVRRRSRLPHPGAGLPASPRGQWAAWGPCHDAPGGRRRRHHDRRLGCSRHPHPRPAAAGVRELDPQGARTRAARRACLHRAPAPRTRDVRARRTAASARGRCTAPTSSRATCSSGIYWQQYGWIAPDEEISGLEDEYRLAPREMPKLVYVKQAAEREERLAGLLAQVRDDDTTSYKAFSTAEELAELIEADLAILLAERFDASRAPGSRRAPPPSRSPPTTRRTTSRSLPEEVLGRETDLLTLLEWLGGDDPRRLVTLVGAGGIGKTRLAIEAARLARDRFDRVTFVPLEHVRDAGGVLPAVARALGVRDDGGVPTLERLELARRGRRDLLVLDNFEQVIAAASEVASLLTELPDTTVHGDEPGPAPGARRAGVRRRAAGPSAGSGRRVPRRGRRVAGGPAVPGPRARRRPAVRPHRGERRTDCPDLPCPRRRAARDRARRGVHPRAHAGGHAREARRDAVPAGDLRPRHARAPAHDARDDRVEHRPARTGRPGPVRPPRRLRRRLQPRRRRGGGGRRTLGGRPPRHPPRARRRQPAAPARRGGPPVLLDARPGA